MPTQTPEIQSVDDVIEMIRPAVRAQHEYVVGAPDGIEVKLNQNESPFDLPEELKNELAGAFAQVDFNRYPDEQPYRLRERIAEYDGVDPEAIIVGNGSNEITYTFGMAFMDPGTPVVLPTPMFSLYEKVARLHEADLTSVGPRKDLSFDTEAIIDAVKRTGARVTIVTSPNNPTGKAMPLADIERIVDAAPGMVVVDEAYVEFNPEGTAVDLLDDHPNVIILRTLSKGFGLAGLRVGYLIGHPRVVREMMKSRLPFMVDRFAEQAALAILNRPDLLSERVEALTASVQQLTSAMEEMNGVEVVPSAANFVLFTTPLSSADLQDRLADQGVLIRDMSGYPELEGYIRVSAGTEAENKAFLGALDNAL
jgi:histidinol-phosphate aminotransferase